MDICLIGFNNKTENHRIGRGLVRRGGWDKMGLGSYIEKERMDV